jgi:hypothetical protein
MWSRPASELGFTKQTGIKMNPIEGKEDWSPHRRDGRGGGGDFGEPLASCFSWSSRLGRRCRRRQPCRCSNSFMYATSACTPSIGMAL